MCGQNAVALDTSRRAPYLDPAALRVVNHQQMRRWIFNQIARCDELPVARDVGSADKATLNHRQETGRATAMLNAGLPVRRSCGQKDAGLRYDEGFEVRRNGGAPAARQFLTGIGAPRALARQDRLDRRGKGDSAGKLDG